MIRKTFILLFLLSALTWQSCEKEKQIGSAISAIPVNAPVVLEVHNINKALKQIKQGEITSPFIALESINTLEQLLKHASASAQLTTADFKGSFYAFANVSGAAKYDWALIASKKELKSFNQFQNIEVEGGQTYSGATIFTIKMGEDIYFATDYLEVLVFSQNESLVEEVVRQLESEVSLENNASFMDHHKIANSSDPVSIYVNLQELPEFTKTALAETKPDWINQLGNWLELDAYAEEKGLFFNGAILNPDSTYFYLNSFKKNGNVKMTASQIVPSNAVAVVMFGTQNFLGFSRNHTDYLKKKNVYRSNKKHLDNLGISLDKDFYPYINEEFGIVYTEPKGNVAQSKMAYFKIKKPESSFKKFVGLAKSTGENYREYPIYKINKEKLLPVALGRAFKGMNAPYFVLHEEWVVFANDLMVLKSAINDWISAKTWAESSSFQNLSAQLDDASNIKAFYKNPGGYSLLQFFMDKDQQKEAKKNKSIFTSSDWLGIQLKNKDDAFLVSAILSNTPEVSMEASQVWALELGASVQGSPQFIYNHSTNKRDILVQNENNELFWINASGEILWKKQLEGAMIGKAVQVDLFKNNKLQLAFTTTKKLYVVDRLGRDVAPFPRTLSNTITAPLAVFDYDKTRNYRLLVASGKELTMFNGEGNIVEGWEFKKATSAVSVKPKHYVLGSRDYIVISENNGNIHFLNRKGQTRIDIKNKFNVKDNIYLEMGASLAESRLLSINNDGYLNYLFLNDKKDSIDLNLDATPKAMAFDGSRQAFTAGDYFFVKDQDFPFKKDVEEEIISKPAIYRVNRNIYYSVTTSENKVYVYGKEGQTMQGFPVYGSSNATVGSFTNSGKVFIVVGSSDGSLYLYRIAE